MKKWEYRILPGYPPSEDKLNKFGEQGWELIAVVTGGHRENCAFNDGSEGYGPHDVFSYSKGKSPGSNTLIEHYRPFGRTPALQTHL